LSVASVAAWSYTGGGVESCVFKVAACV
jgi:hypothetical protein